MAVGPATSEEPAVSGIDAVIKQSGAQSYWIRRVVAFVVDAVIVYVALGIIITLTALPFLVLSGTEVFGALLAGTFSFLGGIMLVLYFAIIEAYMGASFGKRALGLKVVAAGGRYPNGGEALVRNLSKVYWLLLILDVVVGLATSKDYRQKYSDRVMGTTVLSV